MKLHLLEGANWRDQAILCGRAVSGMDRVTRDPEQVTCHFCKLKLKERETAARMRKITGSEESES